jgi:hypothetical protein
MYDIGRPHRRGRALARMYDPPPFFDFGHFNNNWNNWDPSWAPNFNFVEDIPNNVEQATREHVEAQKECEKAKEKYEEAKKQFEECEEKVKKAEHLLNRAKRHGLWH